MLFYSLFLIGCTSAQTNCEKFISIKHIGWSDKPISSVVIITDSSCKMTNYDYNLIYSNSYFKQLISCSQKECKETEQIDFGTFEINIGSEKLILNASDTKIYLDCLISHLKKQKAPDPDIEIFETIIRRISP
ncbi:hypothetical protein GCM10011318_07720 [Phaeocystidibacter marisrubri]|nr:hypothetical protein GCM10011318_07720 [Phaeocystidibacter marisrubri]